MPKARFLLTPAWCDEMAKAAMMTAKYAEDHLPDRKVGPAVIAEFASASRNFAKACRDLAPVLRTAGIKD